jgi:hypothetical protein
MNTPENTSIQARRTPKSTPCRRDSRSSPHKADSRALEQEGEMRSGSVSAHPIAAIRTLFILRYSQSGCAQPQLGGELPRRAGSREDEVTQLGDLNVQNIAVQLEAPAIIILIALPVINMLPFVGEKLEQVIDKFEEHVHPTQR